MPKRSVALIDNTTIDSSVRLLSRGEIERRRNIGWCLRDISDLSCLSSLLDALILFDDLYVAPVEGLPVTSPITSSDSPAERLRAYVTPLRLNIDWQSLAQEAEQDARRFLNSGTALQKLVAMPSFGRGIYSFEKRHDGSIDIHPDRSTISPQEAQRAFQRALLYVYVARHWKKQFSEASLSVWLSPERYLLARRFSLEVKQAARQYDDFNSALGGNLAKLIPTTPSLVTLLVLADREGVTDFASFLVERMEQVRSAQEISGLRTFFNDSLAHPVTREEVEEWATRQDLWEKISDIVGIIPVAGSLIQVFLKWAQEPALKLIGSLTGFDERAFLRSVVNECRYLEVGEVVKLVKKFLAAHEDEKDHYYAHQIGFCVNAFKSLLAGGPGEFEQRDVPIIECI